MTDSTYHTKSGRTLTGADIERLSDEVASVEISWCQEHLGAPAELRVRRPATRGGERDQGDSEESR